MEFINAVNYFFTHSASFFSLEDVIRPEYFTLYFWLGLFGDSPLPGATYSRLIKTEGATSSLITPYFSGTLEASAPQESGAESSAFVFYYIKDVL